jgi:hypothetical protein
MRASRDVDLTFEPTASLLPTSVLVGVTSATARLPLESLCESDGCDVSVCVSVGVDFGLDLGLSDCDVCADVCGVVVTTIDLGRCDIRLCSDSDGVGVAVGIL